jgi:hypothetical protein
MKSFDEWKEANLDEQAAPTAMEKMEKTKLMGKSQTLLKRWLDAMASAGPLTRARKLSALASVVEALGLSPQEVAMMGTKVKGAIKKDASAPAAQVDAAQSSMQPPSE